jgi:hypothetical protein
LFATEERTSPNIIRADVATWTFDPGTIWRFTRRRKLDPDDSRISQGLDGPMVARGSTIFSRAGPGAASWAGAGSPGLSSKITADTFLPENTTATYVQQCEKGTKAEILEEVVRTVGLEPTWLLTAGT